jgi:hypothetical protein
MKVLAMKDVGILQPFGLFYVYLVYLATYLVYVMAICYIFPVLVCCTKKNLATLLAANSIANFKAGLAHSSFDGKTICLITEFIQWQFVICIVFSQKR